MEQPEDSSSSSSSSDCSLTEEDFEALLRADLKRAAEASCGGAGKRAKRRRLQRTATSGGHFARPDEACGEGPAQLAKQPDGCGTGQKGQQPPVSAPTEPAARPRDALPGPGMGTLNLPPKFCSLLRQAVREELANGFQRGRVRSDGACPGPSSSLFPPRRDRSGGAPVAAERIRWPTKAAQKEPGSRKRPRDSPSRGPDPSLESHRDDKEKGVFLSEEEEIDVPPQSARFFKSEDYQYLLSNTLEALNLQGGEEVFPFPKFFEKHLKAEWAKPMANRRFPDFIKKLYALPAHADELLQVPRVDAAVAALYSSSSSSEDGHGSLQDGTDKRADFALRKAHEASAMAIRASCAASTVSRATIVWIRKLLQLIPENDRHLIEGVNRILMAASFIADATLDAMMFSSRAMASAVVARRAIWLRAWQADDHSKDIVLGYPFQGKRLFGDALDRILVETRDKKKVLPRTLRCNDRRPFGNYPFRAQHVLPRFKQEVRRPNWNQSR